MGALEDALILLDENIVLYEALPSSSRRLVNQAIYLALIVRDPETIEAQRTPLYDAIASLVVELRSAEKAPKAATNCHRTTENKAELPSQDDHDPENRGRGSYFEQMAQERRDSNPRPAPPIEIRAWLLSVASMLYEPDLSSPTHRLGQPSPSQPRWA